MTKDTRPAHNVFVVPLLKPVLQRVIMRNWLAITIGRLIFAWRELDEAELAHELTHVRQWSENGFLRYIVRYLRDSSRAVAAGGDRYFDNRFEVEARAAEDAVRQANLNGQRGYHPAAGAIDRLEDPPDR